jgi:hypothetical protein
LARKATGKGKSDTWFAELISYRDAQLVSNRDDQLAKAHVRLEALTEKESLLMAAKSKAEGQLECVLLLRAFLKVALSCSLALFSREAQAALKDSPYYKNQQKRKQSRDLNAASPKKQRRGQHESDDEYMEESDGEDDEHEEHEDEDAEAKELCKSALRALRQKVNQSRAEMESVSKRLFKLQHKQLAKLRTSSVSPPSQKSHHLLFC